MTGKGRLLVPNPNDSRRIGLRITGQVQGVGFRPFVYRLAVGLKLSGWVTNDTDGVKIEFQGPARATETFIERLRSELPPLARIHSLSESDIALQPQEAGFRILPSRGGELADAQVTVDTAVCADCLREMSDPADPRHRYPFINCTNCGPRYTIVRRIPYDRPNTTMADFALCELCARQYADPLDRRFHAQPIACPRCGPRVELQDARGLKQACQDPIAEAARALVAGRIVAIKGLGGIHLACRADDGQVVRRLRRRKRRDAKPFALMVAAMEQARRLCELSPAAEELLSGPLAPVVLADRRPGARVAEEVAEGLATLGIMLPYAPLHHLLFACEGLRELALVMTSGNVSEEPLVKDNADAVAHLGRIADVMLLHDRAIERRIDDSVVAANRDGSLNVLRRARGFAPQPVHVAALPPGAPAVLAVGAELKNTVCLLRDDRALLSEHIGDLTDARTYRHFVQTIGHLERLYDFTPEALAADEHPLYLSSEYALGRAKRTAAAEGHKKKLPVVLVQHHHAHIAACLAECGREGPAIGLACDGVGYGGDGTVWGCEILRADLVDFQRLGHLRHMSLVGGDAAAVETFRPALAALYDAYGEKARELAVLERLGADEERLAACLELLAGGVNCTPSSSLGRWFDAVACLCCIAPANRYEGEAPMRLEGAIEEGVTDAYGFAIEEGECFRIDLRPMTAGLVADLAAGRSAGHVAAKFHNTVVRFLTQAAESARRKTSLGLVALSGGCFANRYLVYHLTRELEARGFEVLRHRGVPSNDGCVALGQAVVAAARLGRAAAGTA